MSTAAIIGIGYAAVFVAGLIRVGYKWDDYDWNDVGPMPVIAALAWPLALPILVGQMARERAARRKLAAEEKRRWLEAPIP